MKREKQKCRKSIVVKPSDSISFISTRAIVDCPLLIFFPLAQLEDTRHHICHQFVLVFVIAPICRASAYLMVPARIPSRPPSSPSSPCPHYRSRESNDITSAFVSPSRVLRVDSSSFHTTSDSIRGIILHPPPRNVSFFEIVVSSP